MSTLNKGVAKVKVTLKWDPSPLGEPDHDLDIVAATYASDARPGTPVYLVHFDSRSPDGTISLNRDSRNGVGFGTDEEMVLELDRLAASFTRVVLGVAIQQRSGRRTFGEITGPEVHILEGYTELLRYDFANAANATAATIAEFRRDASGAWQLVPVTRGFDTDPQSFADMMGTA